MKNTVLVLLLIVVSGLITYCQSQICDINTGCEETPFLSIDPPIFDVTTSSIVLNNVTFGEFACAAENYQSGIIIYVYQLLPNGERMEVCNVNNSAPFNIIGQINIGFGQISICGDGTANFGSITYGEDQGFVVCDGALLEFEAVLYLTNNMSFEPFYYSVYTELDSKQYITVNVGTVEINVNNEFPSGGQPLTTAVINEFTTGSDEPFFVNCGNDVELYVGSYSRIANCPPYSDISFGFTSELESELYYTINDGEPIYIHSPVLTGTFGGQLTGPDPDLGGLCYGGIDGSLVFEWEDLPPNLCNESSVILTIATTDIFTGQTVTDEIEIIYIEPSCPTVILSDSSFPSLPDVSQAGETLTLAFDVHVPENYNFIESAFQFNYNLTFDGEPASQVEQQPLDWYKVDGNSLIFDPLQVNTQFSTSNFTDGANGQVLLNLTVPSCPNPCVDCEISIKIEGLFYEDYYCENNLIAFNLVSPPNPPLTGNNFNDLLVLFPFYLQVYPKLTASVVHVPEFDKESMNTIDVPVININSSNGILCETIPVNNVTTTEAGCPNPVMSEFSYQKYTTILIDGNTQPNPYATDIIIPEQAVSSPSPGLTLNGVLSNTLYEWDSSIISNSTIANDADVHFHAYNRVRLESGFSVPSNTTFMAANLPCGSPVD